ncbi:MAG: EAL domain-containing protein [Acidimicrobiales bacterium]|nr:EAL domain-containing protein [Acidimicrobiales bacterium]
MDTDESVDEPAIAQAIDDGIVRAVFQPVVDLATETAIGWEGFARVGDSTAGFDRWMETAQAEQLGTEFEYSILRAIADHGEPPDDGILFVNVTTNLLADPDFLDECERLAPRLVVDVRGSEVEALSGLDHRLDELAAAGVHLSIDDTTAAGLAMIARIHPTFVKIDRTVINEVVNDPTARSVVAAFLAFAESEEIHVVAEGVERLDQLEMLRDLGMPFAQGFLFGMPAESWSRPRRRRLRPPALFESSRELSERFRSATDLYAVAETACSELGAHGLLPSVYVERDGLLRCVAQLGYWQVFDGVPVRDGVMADAFRSGRPKLVAPEEADTYIAAAPGIEVEMAVPLRVGRRVVGVLNVESRSPFPSGVVEEIELLALAMEERLETVGAEIEQSALHRLARANVELSTLVDVAQIENSCTRLACEISGLSSAMLAVADESGGFDVRALQGPLAPELRSFPEPILAQLAGSLEKVSSCLSSGDDQGISNPELLEMRDAGASSIAAFPVRPGELSPGLLLVADHSPVALDLEEREAMEMLAREVGRALDTAVVMADLRERATRDTLTGLGNVAAFQEALSAIGGRRRGRWAVAMADIDGFKPVNDTYGHLAGDQILRDLAAAMNTVLRAEDRMYRIGGDEFAAILHDVDEEGAAEIGRRVCEVAAEVMGSHDASLSVGIAVPEPHEATTDFLDRADRMLYRIKAEAPGTARVAGPPNGDDQT